MSRIRAARTAALGLAYLFSQVVLLLLLRLPTAEGSWLQSFRGYFSYDQLSYAAITSTTAAGVGGLPEPFTETGHSYYPSLWYRVLGWLAALTGLSTPAIWTIAGWLVLAAGVAFIGWIAYRVSGRAWAPALVAPALLVGTLSVVVYDNWYTPLDSHALLWGPYASIYVLNAEVAGLACISAALAILLWVGLRPRAVAATIGWLTVAAALTGITANLQTYIFFVGATAALGWAAALGLVRARSRTLVVITALLVVLAFPLGRQIGGLLVYGLLVACTLPGIVGLARTRWRLLALPAIVFVLAALPQAIVVAAGVLRSDPFLEYRQDASAALGVPVWQALVASLPILALAAFNLAAALRRKNEIVISAIAALTFAGVMLTFNDWWGFGQEPYRMWIDTLAVGALLLAPVTAWSLSTLSTDGSWRGRPVQVAAVVAGVLVAAALLDFGAWRGYVAESGLIRFDTARYDALDALSADVDGLLATGPCLDPQEVKIVTRKPVVFYNLGLAWPENKQQIDVVLDATRAGVFDPDAMRAAKVRYLVTDSACGTQWPVDSAMGIAQVGTRDYADTAGAGTLTLWRLA